jgi:hypothetical protein
MDLAGRTSAGGSSGCGIRAWRYHSNTRIAAMAAISSAVVAALTAKGMVEPVFEKFRLSVLLGIAIGVLLSAASSLDRVDSARARPEEA